MNLPSTSYTKLEVWNLAIDFCVEVYRVTKDFPKSEQYGMTKQVRDSAASIAANIAEGSGRRSAKDFAWFLDIANGSLRETETFLYVSIRIGYLADPGALFETSTRIGQMITKLRQSLTSDVSTKDE